jgi:hypothetical protein
MSEKCALQLSIFVILAAALVGAQDAKSPWQSQHIGQVRDWS